MVFAFPGTQGSRPESHIHAGVENVTVMYRVVRANASDFFGLIERWPHPGRDAASKVVQTTETLFLLGVQQPHELWLTPGTASVRTSGGNRTQLAGEVLNPTR